MGVLVPVRLIRTRRRVPWREIAAPGVGRQGRLTELACDRGMVTLEMAVVLPLLIMVIIAGTTLLAAGHTQARLTDGARAVARELARGDDPGDALAAGHRVVPGAELTIVRSDAIIEVVARAEVRGPGPILGQLRKELAATVTTRREESW